MAKKSRTTTAVEVKHFNFKYIKDAATPGSWRRGYGYYKTPKQVLSVDMNKKGAVGKVKGNYKSSYKVQLVFDETSVTPKCSCPLDEAWCKHAVVVGLMAIDDHLWEIFNGLPYESPEKTLPLKDTKDFEGDYRFYMDWTIKQKSLSIRVENRRTGKPEKELADVLKDTVEQKRSGTLDMNATQKREIQAIQYLYKHGDGSPVTGWYHLKGQYLEPLLEHLSEVEELCHDKTNARIRFETNPLQLVLSVNASMAGNVMVALHWHMETNEGEEVIPLEEVHLFNRESPWGFYRNKIYPLASTLRNVPNYLTKSSFYDLRDADGGKFVFEELPRLRNHLEVEQAEVIDKATLEKQEKPKRLVTLRQQGQHTIVAELDFSYEGTKEPYSKGNDAPYITVTNKKTGSIYWLKRDKKYEEDAYQELLAHRMQPLQGNMVIAEDDDAIDFHNFERLELEKAGWEFNIPSDLKEMEISSDPLRIIAETDFTPESVDQFTMSICCGIGDDLLDLDKVQSFFTQGKKYIRIGNSGFVEIPLAAILQFTKTLNCFDKEEVERDKYLVKTYQAGLLTEFQDQGVDIRMSDRFQKFWDLITSFDELESIPVPENIQAELRPYQKQGFNWLWFLYTYGLNGVLADDMGLGKTLQALVMLQKAKNDDGPTPSLVICPTSVVFNWKKEIEKFTPDLKVMSLTGSERHGQLKSIEEHDVIITTYALLRRDYKILRQIQFRYVILDESQNIKNFESQTAKASKHLNADHRLALSGTPIENRLTELWSTFDFLMPGFLLELNDFKYQFVTPIEERGDTDTGRRLKKLLAPFILRRMKRDVAKELPDKLENVKYCELLPEQQDLYLDVLEKTREEIFAKIGQKGEGAVSQASVLAALVRLRQVCCHPELLKSFMEHEGIGSGKFEALKEMLEEVIAKGHRVLLFSQFVEMLKIVKDWLVMNGIKHEYLTGETKDRQGAVERFNEDESIPVFLISLKAGGTGLNLTGADYVIHYDPWWNPAVEDQATDRAYRIGQTKKVFVYRIITKGTVEEKIMKLKERKRSLVDTVISVDRDLGKTLTLTDLKDILTPDF